MSDAVLPLELVWRRIRWMSERQVWRLGKPDANLQRLRTPGSLTARLRRTCRHGFWLRLVHESWQRPTLAEARLLGQAPDRYAFIRHVQLMCGNRPWVAARSVLPLSVLAGGRRELLGLGTRPLGDVLFRRGAARRVALHVGQLGPITVQAGTAPVHLWARQSLYHWRGGALLVGEAFYPEGWAGLDD